MSNGAIQTLRNDTLPVTRRTVLAALLSVPLLKAASAASPDRTHPMNIDLKDSAHWKPLCFARLVIQLPPEVVPGSRHRFWGDELVLRKDLTSMELLNKEVAQRQQAFKSQAHKDFGNRYIQTYDLNKRGLTVWGYEFGEASSINGRHYRVTHNYFYSDSPFRVWYMKSDVGQDNIKSAWEYQLNLAKQIRPLADGEIPKEYGYAIEGGLVRSDEVMAEVGEVWFKLPFFDNAINPGQQLVTFGVTSMVNGTARDKLLDRLSPIQSALLAVKGVRVLRKRDLQLNGIEGQEYLYRERSSDDRWSAYSFRWEARGKVDDVYAPNIVVDMGVSMPSTRNYPAPPFKNDDEAVAFWDAIVGTLRMRSVLTAAGTQMSQDGTAIAPVTCGSESLCPKTGVYEASIATTHPDARFVNTNPGRWKYVQQGQSMGTFGVYGEEDKIVWTWIRAERNA